ncbi:zona pellucida sperm-binding protein 3 receptor-like isoform X1 [Peromyscus eremicus]|uniref:zona pellucida sperm-binding protein 3 receptor-like isoform X1 n=2 Tax=Peromyscus eremicus TaxID=42410 RepID=UPI0027DE2953|nr:zona pellucida sperm-binding protein 3 receptor-like isoform X1 [Peromyscus eremicus]
MCSPRSSHVLTKSSVLHRKGVMTAWSFLELWKTSHSTLFQMTLATVLMAPVLGDCGPPPSLPFASPINQLYETTFSSGTVLKYACHHGFKKVNTSHLVCDENGSWIYTIFCAKKRCRNPGELVNGKIDITTDLFLGSTIEFSCAKGYLLIGSTTSRCEVQGKGVDWSDSLPECVIVTCESPPEISNGKHSGREEDLYTYGSSVIYSCDTGFTLLGNASVICTVVNRTVGVWSPSPPACGSGCTGVPDIPYASWEGNKLALRNFQMFEIGTKLKFQCKPGYQSPPNDPQTVTCQENLMWTPTKGCERICCPIPNMEKIKIVSERRDFTGMCTYAYGDYVFYVCGEGASPTSTDGRSACQENGKWDPAIPSCQAGLQNSPAVTLPSFAETNSSIKFISENEEESTRYVPVKAVCPKPVISHGNLSVDKAQYAEMENITVRCDTGYTIVGPPNIICSENRTWYPEIPNCKMTVLEHCRPVTEGRKRLQCFSNPEDVKNALEVYKLFLEIEILEREKEKWTRTHRKPSKYVKIKGPFRPFG